MTSLLRLLHLSDSLFPIGSYGYSDGLEAAAASGRVTGAGGLGEWLEVSLDEGFGRCDGPAMVHAWPTIERADWKALVAIDEEVAALRASSTTRMASRSMGRRLLTTWHALHPDVRLEALRALVREGTLGPSLPVAFSAVSVCAGITIRDALAAYAYSRLAATLSGAMRLVAIGQTDGHRQLARILVRVPAVVDAVMARKGRPESFSPALDIAQMTQQYLHARLFRS